MSSRAEKWIRFLRKYGPIPKNDNMFDEHIRRSAKYAGVVPLHFEHPLHSDLIEALSPREQVGRVVILTGTAGDGKSHLCGHAWIFMGGTEEDWATDEIYRRIPLDERYGSGTLHVIRDLTALRDSDDRYGGKAELLQRISHAMFEPGSDIFLIAANDGQIVENWRRLDAQGIGGRALAILEARLMRDRDPEEAAYLEFFNLSNISSSRVFALSLEAFLGHEAWSWCYEEQEIDGFFGPSCPIRRNYELLQDPLIAARLKTLFRLCDFNNLHTPIRAVMMLLSNAIFGHPAAKDRLLLPSDIRGIVEQKTSYLGSLYNNIFGQNLTASKRDSLEIFEFLNRYGIGHETTNRIDNILIFGAEDDHLRPYFERLIGRDSLYGFTDRYQAAQKEYVEYPEATTNGERHVFLDMLVTQRRALFFIIPDEWVDELSLWSLTVFTSAGEYLSEIVGPLEREERVRKDEVQLLVKGLNRVFTGLLVASERELLLATSLSNSNARVSRLLEDRILVSSRGRMERIEIVLDQGLPLIEVTLPNGIKRALGLNLTRYEFLCRVGDGALPGNFSRECYEDIMSFKTTLLAAASNVADEVDPDDDSMSFRLIALDRDGNAIDDVIEVTLV